MAERFGQGNIELSGDRRELAYRARVITSSNTVRDVLDSFRGLSRIKGDEAPLMGKTEMWGSGEFRVTKQLVGRLYVTFSEDFATAAIETRLALYDIKERSVEYQPRIPAEFSLKESYPREALSQILQALGEVGPAGAVTPEATRVRRDVTRALLGGGAT